MTKPGLIAIAALLTSACAPAYQMRPMPPGPGMYAPIPSYGPSRVESAPPVGRWDNVMMLAAGTPVFVLTMEGLQASGELVGADVSSMRILTASGEARFDVDRVMRVDRLSGAVPARRDIARGAATGLGVVGVMGLLVGHMPPPGMFAAGAIVGGYAGAQNGLMARGSATIYLAPPPVGRW